MTHEPTDEMVEALTGTMTREQIRREVIEGLAKSAERKAQTAGFAMDDFAETAWFTVADWLRSQIEEG